MGHRSRRLPNRPADRAPFLDRPARSIGSIETNLFAAGVARKIIATLVGAGLILGADAQRHIAERPMAGRDGVEAVRPDIARDGDFAGLGPRPPFALQTTNEYST